jgi:tetratricopeptide (TPR) repeat protein
MRIQFWKEQSFRTAFLVLFLILTCGIFVKLKIFTDRISRKKIPGSSIIYLPKGEYLKYATFGHSSLLADLIYIWAIQYYGDYEIPDSYDYLFHIFSIIAELNPHYFDPIDMGAFIAAYEALDVDLAVKILDMGLKKNPKEWFFPYQAAHYLQFMRKDHERAQEYYKKTMTIEGYPPIVRRLYADAIFKSTDYKKALEEWLEIYNTAEDERIKKVASNHLYNIKATMDIEKLQDAIAKFKEKYDRYPADLSRLVSAGFLDSIPKDMDDKEYLYDSQTGEVKPPTIPWKR